MRLGAVSLLLVTISMSGGFYGDVVELADALDLGSSAERRASSSLAIPTIWSAYSNLTYGINF